MVKIGDIAKATGFSVTTVSKALNNYSDISENTKRLIVAKAKEMGYVPNASARSLVMKRSFTMGVIMDDLAGIGFEHPFFSGILQEFKIIVESQGYDILLLAREIGQSSVDSYLTHCRQRGVDGVLILCNDPLQAGIQELIKSTIPCVYFDNPFVDISSVVSDHYQGAKDAIEYLIELGHTKIAHIAGLKDNFAAEERVKAYYDTMLKHGLHVPKGYVRDGGDFNFDIAKEQMDQLLILNEPPTAVFAAGDIMAMGAMRSCYEHHKRIPEDVSVIGFDNVKAVAWTSPRLTTVAQNFHLLGMECSKLIIDQIENGGSNTTIKVKIPTQLMLGETVRKI